MSLSLSRVTSVWGYSLAELQPVPAEKLDVLLRVCVGDSDGGEGVGTPKDAGDVLQRILPLTMFLEKCQGKNSARVVPAVVHLLSELPKAWGATQNGPLQAQADFTQMLLDLRRCLRSQAMAFTSKQEISGAMQQLIQQLFTTAAAKQSLHESSWVKSGCNLLLRALTRSPQFISDPGLPMLPEHALAALQWFKQHALDSRAPATAAAGLSSSSNGHADVAPSPFAAAAGSNQPGGLLLRDDKMFLLLTKVILTATGAPATVASAAAAAEGGSYYSALSAAATSAAVAAATGNGSGAAGGKGSVRWADGPEGAVAAGAAADGMSEPVSASAREYAIRDPALLCELLEWSSTKVEMAMQQLLEPTGSPTAAGPSREATTASAQMAATCIHILQSGPALPPHLEQRLRQQVEQLLLTALAVGEAAVASASGEPHHHHHQQQQHQRRDADADKVLALGARILASMTPFVAAAAQRSKQGKLFVLTNRLQQLMLAAANLAGRRAIIVPKASGGVSSAGGAASTGASADGLEAADGLMHMTSLHHLAHVDETGNGPAQQDQQYWASQTLSQQQQRGQQQQQRHHLGLLHKSNKPAAGLEDLRVTLRSGMSRLEARKAAAGHQRAGKAQHQQQQQQRRLHWDLLRPRTADIGARSNFWGVQVPDAAQRQARLGLLDSGLGLGEDLPRQLLLAEADPVMVPPEDVAHPWSWDVTQPLTTLSGGVKLSQLPLSTGVGGFLLARAACEMLCEALAAAWVVGRPAGVRRLMLLPQSGTSQRAVTALAISRLYVKLQADNDLGHLLLPLLADLLTSSTTVTAPAGGISMAGGPLASLGSLAGAPAAADAMPADASAANGQPLPAEVAGAVVCGLEGMASACVQHGRDPWLYEQALQLLLVMYREPTPLSLQLLAGQAAPPSTAGLLADTLHLLAVGLEDAPQRARQDLSLKLLLLFSEVAARVGSGSGVVTADLGDLLVAVAVAAEGLQPRTLRLLGSSSNSSRMSIHDIQSAQREDASTTRLFRNLWLYTAMHKLVIPAAGTTAAAAAARGSTGGGGVSSVGGGVVAEWQVAAGRLAAVTPLLVVGTDSYHEADMVERLKVELGEQLSQAGSLGSTFSLSTALVILLGGKANLDSQMLPQLSEAVLLAFVVAVAISELSRAALAPLPDLEDDPVVACPVSVTLGYLKGVLPDGVAAAWVAAIVRQAAKLYIRRLLELAARQEREEEMEGVADTTSPGMPPAPALAYAEQLACALIAHLGGGMGADTATEGTSSTTVAALADELLVKLLAAFPALYHSQPCYAALLVQLQREEGDVPMGQVKSAHQGLVWGRTKAWVEAAAEVAPLTTEAVLHSFLTSSDSLPGATAPAWLQDEAPTSLGGGPGISGQLQESRQAHIATQKAAFRRAADLLQACGAARRRQQPGAALGDGAYEGALGLTWKLHYTGYVQGLINGHGCAVTSAVGGLPVAQQQRQQRQLQQPARLEAATIPAVEDEDDDDVSTSSYGTSMIGTRQAVGAAAAVAADGNTTVQRSNILPNLRGIEEEVGLLQNGAAGAAANGDGDESDEECDGGCDGSVASEATQVAVAEEIATQLEQALLHPVPRESKLAVAQLSASALLAVQPDAFSYSTLGMKLLRALARTPLKRLTPETMRLSQFCWCWVCVESPEVLVPLLSGITNAWIWTIDQRMGLFSGTPPATETGAVAGSGTAAAGAAGTSGDSSGRMGEMLADDHGSEDDSCHDEGMLQAIAAHFLWLSYLFEQWVVVSRLRDGRAAAARVMYGRLLAASLQDPSVLSHHPAAVGAYFRLLTLALKYGRSCLAGAAGSAGRDVLLLFDRIMRAALLWFKSPPRYFARCTRQAAAEHVAALQTFMFELNKTLGMGIGLHGRTGGKKVDSWPSYRPMELIQAPTGSHAAAVIASRPHPVWGMPDPSVGGYISLLQLLCEEELMRLRVWTEPLKYADPAKANPVALWRDLVPLAWQVDPSLALSLLDHFPAVNDVKAALQRLVVQHASDAEVQNMPKAALLLATAPDTPARTSMIRYLPVWAPGTAAQGLQLLSGPAGSQPAVRSYAINCLFNERPERLVFFLPQLVQLLRGDADGAIRNFFLTAAAGSDLFAHQLIWILNSEARPPEEAFNPEVKRSGWQPPKDTGLWDIAAQVRQQIEQQMTPAQQEYWKGEGGYFDQVTSLSGYLYKFAKDERRVKLQEALAQFKPPRSDLYLPTNPEAQVKCHIPSSGACMQSAAKVPILVAFDVEVPVVVSSPREGSQAVAAPSMAPAKMACIFKVGDDIRQDVLAIQVIRLLHDAFEAAGLNLYLRPYGCLPTGYECGIIEVVPNTRSRAALGELSDRGLHDIFCAEFGAAGSAAFEKARENFIVSEAAYAVASYLLQAKDRHNGNIMLDDQGHIVHIDFGFILEISPGGNLGFESAAFKLSHEMTQVLDPGGRRSSPQLALFEELVVRAYLAARTVAEPIIATVSLMAESGLPCFSRGAPVANLRNRFHLEMTDAQAAAFMRSQIADAYDKWTTGFYDYIQSLQNKIPY